MRVSLPIILMTIMSSVYSMQTGFKPVEFYPSLSFESILQGNLHRTSLNLLKVLRTEIQKGEIEVPLIVNGVYQLRSSMNNEVITSQQKIEHLVLEIKEKVRMYKGIVKEYLFDIEFSKKDNTESVKL